MSISKNALTFYHTYTIESKKKSVYFTDFSIKTSFSLEYRDRFERLLGSQNEPAFSSLANHSMSSRQAAGSGAYSALTKAAEFRRCHGV